MVEVKSSTPNLDRIEREMKYLATHGVKVGVLGDELVLGEKGGDVTVKLYAFWLMTGTKNKDKTQKMPPRDFMQHALRNKEARLETARLQRSLLSKVFNGDLTGEQALMQIGVYAVQKIKASIMSNEFTPLAESTIKNKKRNKNNILRDSDTLLNSIAFEVVKL